MSFGVRQVDRSDRWLEYPAVGRSVGRTLVDGFDQEKARAGEGFLCGAITQRGTPTNRRNAEIQKQQTSWRYKKRKTRNEERRSTRWKPDLGPGRSLRRTTLARK